MQPCSYLSDWNTHLDLRKKITPTVTHQLSSRLEDLKNDSKVWKYKDNIILPAFERPLVISRDTVLEKVVKNSEKEDRVNITLRYNYGAKLNKTGAI